MQHVIIGAGPAGVVAAETIRKADPSAKVTLIGNEPENPYSRMAIPYYLVGQIPEEGTHLRKTACHFEDNSIEVRKEHVAKVDTASNSLTLESGDTVSYDRLLIATGSRPMHLPIPGSDLPGVVNCWTLEDARQIASVCKAGNKAVLIGAGFIGCIILEALARSGVELTVVEAENRMVPRMMNDAAGGLIKDWCEQQGVAVRTSSRVKSIKGGSSAGFFSKLFGGSPSNEDGLTVELESGEKIAADIVISATGVEPNTHFLKDSGIKIDHGIVVNDRLQTNVVNVYAAGDVCQGYDFSTGLQTVQAIQPTATEHGRVAASNMVGHDLAHIGSVNMNVLDTMGLISSSFGMWMGVDGGESAELNRPEAFQYMNIQFKDDVIVGASSLGLTNHVGVLRGLIQSRTHLGEWKQKLMDDPTRIMDAFVALNMSPSPRGAIH